MPIKPELDHGADPNPSTLGRTLSQNLLGGMGLTYPPSPFLCTTFLGQIGIIRIEVAPLIDFSLFCATPEIYFIRVATLVDFRVIVVLNPRYHQSFGFGCLPQSTLMIVSVNLSRLCPGVPTAIDVGAKASTWQKRFLRTSAATTTSRPPPDTQRLSRSIQWRYITAYPYTQRHQSIQIPGFLSFLRFPTGFEISLHNIY